MVNQFQPAEPEPRRVHPGEGEGTSHTLMGYLGWLLPGPLGAPVCSGPVTQACSLWEGCCLHQAPPCGLDAPAPHRVVDGSFLTRRWARMEVSIGFSWGVGLELFSAEYVAAMAPWAGVKSQGWEVSGEGTHA